MPHAIRAEFSMLVCGLGVQRVILRLEEIQFSGTLSSVAFSVRTCAAPSLPYLLAILPRHLMS